MRKSICSLVATAVFATIAVLPAAFASSAPQWKPVLYHLPADGVSASSLGVIPDDQNRHLNHDVTAVLQKAIFTLRPGQTLLLSPGLYHISATIRVPSGVSLQGQQDNSGAILSFIVQTKPLGTWTPGKLGKGVLMNENYDASTIMDKNITVTAVGFEDQSFGIVFRMTQDVRIQGCRFNSGGDGVAFLASHRTMVIDSFTANTRNAAYDYWDGDVDSTIENSVAVLAGGYGISFNAMDTDGTGRIATNLSAINNVISGAGNNTPAIYVNPLGGGSKITGTVTISNNKITSPQANVRTGGIYVVDGDANVVDVQGNYVSGSKFYQPIFVGGNRKSDGYVNPGRPVKTWITNNIVEHNVINGGSGAVISADGERVYVSRNTMRFNVSEKGDAMPFLQSSGHVYSWDNRIDGGGDIARSYKVLPNNLTLHAPPAGQ
ncbi:MAG: right-handed parallel beta-helix repeat-containing protein [Rhodopila sp.]|nr:right-handed parallel beta-helix repeat-containing protein [Rhodopila sp.]